MDIVTRLMSALTPRAVDTVTWLPREQNKLYPNGTAVSTYGSYTEISEAITVVLKRYSWSNIGKHLYFTVALPDIFPLASYTFCFDFRFIR